MNLLPRVSTQTAIERRLSSQILRLNPGLRTSAEVMLHDLADSGLGPALSSALLQAVYVPDNDGRGQTTRIKHFVDAVRKRYDRSLVRIQKDSRAARCFIADMEEVSDMRDTLRGEGITVSFHAAFLLWEIGEDADTVLSTIQSLCGEMKYLSVATKYVIRAAQLVQQGRFMELDTAVEELKYGYEYELRPEDIRND